MWVNRGRLDRLLHNLAHTHPMPRCSLCFYLASSTLTRLRRPAIFSWQEEHAGLQWISIDGLLRTVAYRWVGWQKPLLPQDTEDFRCLDMAINLVAYLRRSKFLFMFLALKLMYTMIKIGNTARYGFLNKTPETKTRVF